jgi:hypothetical protein
MLVNSGVTENDEQRAALYQFISDLHACYEYDFDILQVAGAAYLRKLSKLSEDEARLVGAEAAVSRLKSGMMKPILANDFARRS